VPIALARLPHPRRFHRAQHGVEHLVHQLLDRVADLQPHRHLDAVGAERRDLFFVAWLPATVVHRVILPAPAAKRAHSCWFELRRMMTRLGWVKGLTFR
jgi:hypothetical protein